MATDGNFDLLGLSAEIVESIVECLDLVSIANLRLTCSLLAIRCSGPRFKSHFNHVQTDLSESSLESLNALASHPTFGPAVKNLTAMATVYDCSELKEFVTTRRRRVIIGRGETEHTDEKLTKTQITSFKSDLEWMKARKAERIALSGEFIVNSLASALTSFGELDSLELDAAVIENPYGVLPTHSGIWKDIWVRASMVYRFTTSALAKSGTPVGTFGVYRNTHECSVPSYDVTVFPEYLDEADGFIAFTSSIRNLALKVDAIRSLFPTGSGLEKPGAYGEENFRGVARLLRLMPKLETLHLHLCYAYNGDERLFTAIAEDVHLPSLKKCVLGGIRFHQMTILWFLQRHPHIEHLELIESRLSAGWAPIFEHLSDTSKMPALTHLRLSNLCENGQLENLKPIWEDDISHYSVKEWCSSCLDGTLFHTREFDADDLRKGLVFEPGPEDRPYVLMTPRYSDNRVVIYGVPRVGL